MHCSGHYVFNWALSIPLLCDSTMGCFQKTILTFVSPKSKIKYQDQLVFESCITIFLLTKNNLERLNPVINNWDQNVIIDIKQPIFKTAQI